MNRAVIIVGLRSGDAHRDSVWEWCRRRWSALLPLPIVEGHHGSPGGGDAEGPFCLSVAFNRAARAARVLHPDADVFVQVGGDWVANDDRQVAAAIVEARRSGQLTFAHDATAVLSEDVSLMMREQMPLTAPIPSGAGVDWHDNTFSGVLAVPVELWQEAGGFDERFVGWGWDDLAFWSACTALRGGFGRVPGSIAHLWHPGEWEDREGAATHPPNQVLGERYLAAKWDRPAMLAILAEPGGPLA